MEVGRKKTKLDSAQGAERHDRTPGVYWGGLGTKRNLKRNAGGPTENICLLKPVAQILTRFAPAAAADLTSVYAK